MGIYAVGEICLCIIHSHNQFKLVKKKKKKKEGPGWAICFLVNPPFSKTPGPTYYCWKLLQVKSIKSEKFEVSIAKDLGQHRDGQVFGWRIFLPWLADSKIDFGLPNWKLVGGIDRCLMTLILSRCFVGNL